MRNPFRLLPLFCFALLLTGCFLTSPPSPDEIIADWLDSRRSAGVAEPVLAEYCDFDADVVIRLRHDPPDRFRIDVTGPGIAVGRILRGNRGWEYDGGRQRELTPGEVMQMRRDVTTLPFAAFPAVSREDSRLSSRAVRYGERVDWLLISDCDGGRELRFGSVDHLLYGVAGSDGTLPREIAFFDYDIIDGVLLPRVIIERAGNAYGKLLLLDFRRNVDFDDAVFELLPRLSMDEPDSPCVVERNPAGMMLGDSAGSNFVAMSKLPAQAQRQYGFDPERAAAYEQELRQRRSAALRRDSVQREQLNRLAEGAGEENGKKAPGEESRAADPVSVSRPLGAAGLFGWNCADPLWNRRREPEAEPVSGRIAREMRLREHFQQRCLSRLENVEKCDSPLQK